MAYISHAVCCRLKYEIVTSLTSALYIDVNNAVGLYDRPKLETLAADLGVYQIRIKSNLN